MKKSTRRHRRHRNPKKQELKKPAPFFSSDGASQAQAKKEDVFFQSKLEVSPANDPAEKEADTAADKVVKNTQVKSEAIQQKEKVSRQVEEEEPQTKLELQRQAEEEEEPQAKREIQRQVEEEEPQAKLNIQRQVEEEEPQAKLKLQRQTEEEEEPQAKREIQRQVEEEEPQAKLDIQRQVEEEELQAKVDLQRQVEEEEEPQTKLEIQRQAEEEEPQTKLEIQRQVEEEEPQAKLQPTLQQKAENQEQENGTRKPNVPMEELILNTKGKGFPLPDGIRGEMEAEFEADFSQVRIHTDDDAIRLNRGLQAQAFTHGYDIYFNKGKYKPDTQTGRHLLAHELTHVVQQKGN